MLAISIDKDVADRNFRVEGIEKSFSRWKGASGATYIFSTYDPDAVPHYPHAVYVIVSRFGESPSLIAATNSLPDLMFLGMQYRRAVSRPEATVYVHVPANKEPPETIAEDISAAHQNSDCFKSAATITGPKLPDVARLFLLNDAATSRSNEQLKLAS